MPMRKITVDGIQFEWSIVGNDPKKLFYPKRLRIRDTNKNNYHYGVRNNQIYTPFYVANVIRKHILGVPEVARPERIIPPKKSIKKLGMVQAGYVYVIFARSYETNRYGDYIHDHAVEFHLDPTVAKERTKNLNGDMEEVYKNYLSVRDYSPSAKQDYFIYNKISPEMQERLSDFDPYKTKFYYTEQKTLFDKAG